MRTESDTRWWLADEQAVGAVVVDVARTLLDNDDNRQREMAEARALYGDASPSQGLSRYQVRRRGNATVSLNVVRQCCSALVAELLQNRPRPMFLTSGADWQTRRAGGRLNKLCEGVFAETGFDATLARVVQCATVLGAGAVKVAVVDGRVTIEHVPPGELLVDARDAARGSPRSLYQLTLVDRAVLAELFPDKRKAIEAATPPRSEFVAAYLTDGRVADLVEVAEAWHLPSSKTSGDGRHVIAVDGAALVDETWERSTFPVVVLHHDAALEGYWTGGLPSVLKGLQLEINRLLRDIQAAQMLNGMGRLLIDGSTQISPQQIDNLPGSIIRYKGAAPTMLAGNTVSPELYAQLDRLYQKSFEIAGVSAMGARAEKPAGLSSGKALTVYNDTQSRRFLRLQRAIEDFVCEVARQVVHAVAQCDGYSVTYQGRKALESVRASDLSLADDDFRVQCFPISFFASTPAGKLEQLQQLIGTGLADQLGLPREAIVKALDFPDIESALATVTSAYDLCETLFERWLEDPTTYEPPEPFYNLTVCATLAAYTYMQWRAQEVPDDRLACLRSWIQQCKDLSTPPAPMPAELPPGAEMAPPELPPGPMPGAPN